MIYPLATAMEQARRAHRDARAAELNRQIEAYNAARDARAEVYEPVGLTHVDWVVGIELSGNTFRAPRPTNYEGLDWDAFCAATAEMSTEQLLAAVREAREARR